MTDAPIRWSKEPPTVPGVYRCRPIKSENPLGTLVDVWATMNSGASVGVVDIKGTYFYANQLAYEWSQRFVPEHSPEEIVDFLNAKKVNSDILEAISAAMFVPEA